MDDILKVFLGAINSVLHYKKSLFKALLIPLTALILLFISEILFDMSNIMTIIFWIVGFLLQTIIAVTTHRIILLGESSVPEWGRIISMHDIRFILYTIALAILMIPAFFLYNIPVIGLPIAVLLMIYLLARLSLIFPSTATGQNWSLLDSWVNTREHKILMLVTVLIFPIIFGIPEYLLAHLPYSEIPVAVLSSFTTIFVVSALSVAFKLINGDVELEDDSDDEYHPIPEINSNNPYT